MPKSALGLSACARFERSAQRIDRRIDSAASSRLAG
jgi:hypothetical protein